MINSPSEAWEIAGHLQAIATMMVQTFYAMAHQEQTMMQQIMAEEAQKLWTPNGK